MIGGMVADVVAVDVVVVVADDRVVVVDPVQLNSRKLASANSNLAKGFATFDTTGQSDRFELHRK